MNSCHPVLISEGVTEDSRGRSTCELLSFQVLRMSGSIDRCPLVVTSFRNLETMHLLKHLPVCNTSRRLYLVYAVREMLAEI